MQLTTDLFKNIKKDELVKFFHLENEKKSRVVAKSLAKLADNPDLVESFFKYFAYELALNSRQVRTLLNITKGELQRWIEEGRLKLLYEREYTGQINTYVVKYYDRWLIENLSQDTINKWRTEHAINVVKNRKAGAKKAVKTKRYTKEYTSVWLSSIDIVFDDTISNEDLAALKLESLHNDNLIRQSPIEPTEDDLYITCSIGYLRGEIYVGLDMINIELSLKSKDLYITAWPRQFSTYAPYLGSKAFKYKLSTLYKQNKSIMSLIREKIILILASFFCSPIEKLLVHYEFEKYVDFAKKCMYAYITNSPNINKLVTIYNSIKPLSVLFTDKTVIIDFLPADYLTISVSSDPKNFYIDEEGALRERMDNGSTQIYFSNIALRQFYLCYAPCVQELLKGISV